MSIHSFLKAEKGDPDWQFTPEQYFAKEFKVVNASDVQLNKGVQEQLVLRQNPIEKELLAKNINIHVKDDSTLELVVINDSTSKLQQIFLYNIILGSNSSINFGLFVKNGKFNKHILEVSQEEGSSFNCYGLMKNTVGGDTEIITKIVQNCPITQSSQLIIGISGVNSQTVFQGMSILDEGSTGSQSNIESNNLMLDNNSRCFSKPEIYINCEGVGSAHSSRIESLDLDKIYYLTTKGITKERATQILIEGYYNQAISLLPSNSLKEEVTSLFLN
jgi:Fe-S cluster assembly protein SufD